MKKKLLLLVIIVLIFTASTGCFSFVDWTHNSRHLQAWNNQLRDMHRSLDRFIFDYDWDDPFLEVDDGS